MGINLDLNVNQSPYFDDYDEAKDFHQVLYKPAVAVQARELSQEQTILRHQLKRFGDHVFQNGSKVVGGDLVVDIEYHYVKLQANYNAVAITPALLSGKTIVGSESGAKATVINTAAVDAVLGDPDTIWVKYLSGGSITDGVQGIEVTAAGSGYTSVPTVTISAPPSGTTATATAVVGSSNTIIGIDIVLNGTGYTSAPTATITGGGGSGATAVTIINTSALFVAGERITATDVTSSVLAASSSPTGLGSATGNTAGTYYFNGNFIRTSQQTLILDKYTNTPTYRIGFQVAATIVDSGDDSTLLDNATGSFNYAAPGADRLKYTLTLAKKSLTSTDDTDFIEMIQVNDGVNEYDVKYPVYSVLGDTFARRTYDESGSYTVRHFPIQFKQHSSDATKFILKLDPGKAYIYGYEHETLVSVDIEVDRARDTRTVSNFDRLIQYGNYIIVDTLTGHFDSTANATVDLHNNTTISLLSPTNYTATKIGTARVRQLDYTSGTATSGVPDYSFNMYLYDVQLTSGAFADIEELTIPNSTNLTTTTVASVTITAGGSSYSSVPTVAFSGGGGSGAAGTAVLSSNAVASVTITNQGTGYTSVPTVAFSGGGGSGATGTVVLTPVTIDSKCNIANAGKVGGVTGGDAQLFETDNNIMLFQLAQPVIKTIRDDSNAIDTSYQIQRTYQDQQITGGQIAVTSGGATETFFGTGVLSDTIKRTHYHAVVKTAGNSGLTVGNQINFEDGVSGVITIAGNGQTATLNTGQSGHTYTADIIATLNLDAKQEKIKTLVKNATLAITSRNVTSLGYDALNLSDVNEIKAVYDSGATGTDAVAPTLTVSGATGTFIAGETITGGTSGAKGTVILHSPATTITFVVTSGTFAGTETITGTTYSATMASLVAGSTEIKSRYTLDTGQRDNFYDHGRLQLTGTAPAGRILIVMDYFTHSGVGYCSVDSYSATIAYADIPDYKSTTTGFIRSLRDCIDFRPRRQDGAGNTAMQNIEIPYPNTNWSADYIYYLPRIDAVFLSKEKIFGTETGISRELPIPPLQKDGVMNLWYIRVPAYTFDTRDIGMLYIENRRYTMRDIAGIEKRVKRMEYYTSLSLLEKDAEALVIKDTAGLDRFKNGILVDGFKGHSIGAVLDPDYKCSIDFPRQELRAPFNSNIVDLFYVSASSTGVQQTGDLITLPYTVSTYHSQTQATNSLNVNPFQVVQYVGTCDLDPPSDNWISVTNAPDVIVNNGANDNWVAFARNLVQGFGTQWQDWATTSQTSTSREGTVGPLLNTSNRAFFNNMEGEQAIRAIWSRTTTTTNQNRSGVQLVYDGVDTVRTDLGDRVRDVSIIPFIRAQEITVTIKGMKPSTRIYPFFDGEAISTYCTPSGGSLGGAIYTDNFGDVDNLLFSLPCPVHAQLQDPPLLVFRTGERDFLVTDNTSGDVNTASTFANAMFQAQGLLQTKESVIISTRVPRVISNQLTDTRTLTNTTMGDTGRVGDLPFLDPLAQTFNVDANQNPEGIALTSVDLYFKTKDANLPVLVDLVTTETGFPTTTVIPFTEVVKKPADVNVSADATTATTFAFPSTVHLIPGEYAIRIRTNSLGYEVWVAEVGQNRIGTNRKVSKQPYLGVIFKSQNASTWQQDQNTDLTFVLKRANYTIAGTHEAVFQNITNPADYKMDVMDLIPQEIKPNATAIDWSVKTTLQSNSQLATSYTDVVANETHKYDNQQIITTTDGTFLGKAVLSSTSVFVSPAIDTKRLSVIPVENLINNLATNEAAASGGDALARYITRRVTLQDGFDATDLSVYLTICKQASTDVKCYYKILSQYDFETFDDKLWVLMAQSTGTNSITGTTNTVSLTENQFIEFQFDPSTTNTSYTSGGVTFLDFKVFAIKIVMNSTNTSIVPRIRDLRAIALL